MKLKAYLPSSCFLTRPDRFKGDVRILVILNTGGLPEKDLTEIEVDLKEYIIVATKKLMQDSDCVLAWFERSSSPMPKQEDINKWKVGDIAHEAVERRLELSL